MRAITFMFTLSQLTLSTLSQVYNLCLHLAKSTTFIYIWGHWPLGLHCLRSLTHLFTFSAINDLFVNILRGQWPVCLNVAKYTFFVYILWVFCTYANNQFLRHRSEISQTALSPQEAVRLSEPSISVHYNLLS